MNEAMPSLPGESRDGHLRVSDRERDDAIELLAQAATDGRLTLDEYGERTDKALVAVTRDDLAVLSRDLATDGSRASRPEAAAEPARDRVIAIFGSEHRRGQWQVPARLDARVVFGECTLELQEASLHARVTVLDLTAMFGNVEILVPHGVEVRMMGMSIFGSRSCRIARETFPGAPIVEVRARAVFGEITVRHPGWKEDVRSTIRR